MKSIEKLTAGCAAKSKAKNKTPVGRLRLLLMLALVCLAGFPWLILFWAGVQERYQQPEADSRANAFFSQFSTVLPNAAAEQIDRIGGKLGFSPNARYLEPIAISQTAQADFREIDADLTLFLQRQTGLISGPLDPLPANLTAYLDTYSGLINEAKQQVLQGDLPQWEMTLETMFDPNYPSPGFFNIRYLQKLILLSAIANLEQGQTAPMWSAMEASWRLNQAIAQRPDLVSQLLSSIILSQQASLLRHFEDVPVHWQTRLASQSPLQAILTGLQFENWLNYKISQSAWSPHSNARWFSAQSSFKLKIIKAAETTQIALDELSAADVCSTPQIAVERRLRQLQTDQGNFSSTVMARRWRSAGDRALALELSRHVLAAKQLREKQGEWPTWLLNLDSQTCPGERWVYKLTEDRITLSLSKQLVTGTAIPLRYSAERQVAVSASEVP